MLTLSEMVIFLHGGKAFVDERYSASLEIGGDTLDHRDLMEGTSQLTWADWAK